MHYQSNAFAKQGTYTLLSKIAPQIIQRNLLITDIDAREIQLLYKCTGDTSPTTQTPTTTSTPKTTLTTTTASRPTTRPSTTTRPTTSQRTTPRSTTKTTTTLFPTQIQWNEDLGNSWSFGCNFANNDLTNVITQREFCSSRCRLTLGCTHYTWSNGVCYLKRTAVTKANAVKIFNQNAVCGILTPGISN